MTLTIALQMDPLHSLDVENDSSLMLGLEAQRRGYRLYHYLPQHLSLKKGRVSATGHAVSLREPGRRESGKPFECGVEEELPLADFDVILLRQDPPFDLAYLTTTWLLEKLHPQTLVVNDPAWIRSMPEKIFVTEFPDLMPPTLITSDPRQVSAFRSEHRDIIVKPLYGNGGAGVFHLPPEDENLSALIELYQKLGREPFMVQRYLPEVRAGDKRIILIDGQPAGGVLRVPATGEARANLHVGGQAVKTELTRRDLEICERIGPMLRERGQIFVGIDVIGDFLTEINVTSPTGIQQINRLDALRLEAQIWDAIEKRL